MHALSKSRSKNFPPAPFFKYFLQLVAEKKYSKNGAAGKFFGPSYFVTALVYVPKDYWKDSSQQ